MLSLLRRGSRFPAVGFQEVLTAKEGSVDPLRDLFSFQIRALNTTVPGALTILYTTGTGPQSRLQEMFMSLLVTGQKNLPQGGRTHTHDPRTVYSMFRMMGRTADPPLGKKSKTFGRVSTHTLAYPEVSLSPAGTGNTQHPSGTPWAILSLKMEQQGSPAGLQLLDP